MDWSNILEDGQAIIAAIVLLGGNTVVNIFTFAKTLISGKRFTKVSDFSVIVSKTLDYAKQQWVDLKGEVKGEVSNMKKDVVQPLLDELKSVREDNAKLADLSVAMISLIPIPVAQKQQFLAVLAKVGTVSQEAVNLLQANVTAQIEQETTAQTANDNLIKSAEDI